LPKQGYFFSGDLFIANKLKMMRSDENLVELVASMQKVLALDFDVLFCPHAGIVSKGKAPLQQKLDYILDMCAQVQALTAKGWDLQAVCDKLLGPKDMMGRVTGGNFSKLNLINQCDLVTL